MVSSKAKPPYYYSIARFSRFRFENIFKYFVVRKNWIPNPRLVRRRKNDITENSTLFQHFQHFRFEYFRVFVQEKIQFWIREYGEEKKWYHRTPPYYFNNFKIFDSRIPGMFKMEKFFHWKLHLYCLYNSTEYYCITCREVFNPDSINKKG